MCSDESCFQLFMADSRVRVLRKHYEPMDINWLAITVNPEDYPIMLWNVLVHLRTYRDVTLLRDQLRIYMNSPYPNKDELFQQVNVSCH